MGEPPDKTNPPAATRRRSLRFASPDDIVRDAETVAAGPHRCLDNWSLGQICRHLALAMDWSAGLGPDMPDFEWWLRLAGPLFKPLVLRYGVPAGYRLRPASARVTVPGPVGTEDGLRELREAVRRLAGRTERRPRHPVWGNFSREDWDRFHCRHAEMHLSFAVPIRAAEA